MTDTLETLAEKAEAMAAEHRRVPSLDLVRAALNESGIRRARSAMVDSPDVLANAQETLRSCQAGEAAAKEAYDAALAEASWVLDGAITREGNKSFINPYMVTPDGHIELYGPAALGPKGEPRQVTADQAKAWVAAEAAKQPAVAKAAAALSGAAAETSAARDSVEVARLRCSVARHDCDAAVAELEALTVAIPRSGTQ